VTSRPGIRLTAGARAVRYRKTTLPRVVPVETHWPRLEPICRPSHQLDVIPPCCRSLAFRPGDVTFHYRVVFSSRCARARNHRRT
jgi:hypothetical protein